MAIPAFGRCIVNFKVFIKGKWILKGMGDVWYVPKLGLSRKDGCTFRKNGCLKLSDESSLEGIYDQHMRV
ncbi:hypothetical protein T02_15346 [Trichinella nativa]|uniref:Uncharacterized protein n=1 Tax=Trichinella nativa TaxID=6335 RepID=A0A0V1L7F9_9BILA|nr:hypothetical protein T02_15346 [Trichinella nativa]